LNACTWLDAKVTRRSQIISGIFRHFSYGNARSFPINPRSEGFFFSRRGEALHQRREPTVFFLIGAERSGTTLLRLMLDHHAEISCGGEFNYVTAHLQEDGSEPTPKLFEEALRLDRQFSSSGLAFVPVLDYAQQVRSFLIQLCRDGRAVGATVHFNYRSLVRWWPEARFIHLVRDPRDVSISVIQMGWSGNLWAASKRWLAAERAVEEFREQVPDARIHELRFEDLVSHPVEELSALCSFLDLEYDPGMLSYPANSTYPAPDPKAAERWRKKLTTDEVQLVEQSVGDWLLKRGYPHLGSPPLDLDSKAIARLVKQDAHVRRKNRVICYGYRLLINLRAAKLLRLNAWRDRIIQRMQAIDRSLLR
jgi:sulfotransferase family protein